MRVMLSMKAKNEKKRHRWVKPVVLMLIAILLIIPLYRCYVRETFTSPVFLSLLLVTLVFCAIIAVALKKDLSPKPKDYTKKSEKKPIKRQIEEDRLFEMIYATLTADFRNADQIRWTRLNTLLLFDSVLILAWATVFAVSGCFACKIWLLTWLCLPGLMLGVPWGFLENRSSDYQINFKKAGLNIENSVDCDLPKPFHIVAELQEKLENNPALWPTSSISLVTWVPVILSLTFLGLLIVSWLRWWYC